MKKKTITLPRLIILAALLIYISFEAYMHQVKGGGPDGAASIHALCPYGGLESLYTIFTADTFIDKLYSGTFVLFAVTIILAVIFRRAFCGWLCPLGGIQEFIGRLGRKMLGKQLVMPVKADKYLRYLKYVVLIMTAAAAWGTASIWMSPYDPWAAYGHLGEGLSAVWNEFAVGLIILIITAAGSFFYDRFFCKYLCPMGAFLGIISKISPFKIQRDPDICINCNLCTKACMMNIDVAKAEMVNTAECINCQECTDACPREGALTNKFSFKKINADKKSNLKPLQVGIIILLIYFGGIGISAVAGLYNLRPTPITAETVIADPDQLKGYMTISEVSSAMGLPLDEIYKRLEIPRDLSADTTMKEISQAVPGFDFHTARENLRN